MLRQAYGHFFDLTIVNNDIGETIAALEAAIEKVHSSSQWVPVGWLYWPADMQLDWPNQVRHGRQQQQGRSAQQQHNNQPYALAMMDDNCNEMDEMDGECDCELCQLGGGGGGIGGQGGGGVGGGGGGRVGGFVNVGELSGSRFDLK